MMGFDGTTTIGLWLAVMASGVFHGMNPGMGWPLAVSAGMTGRGRRDLLIALISLTLGHLLAMLVVLLPFALLTGLVRWQFEIRVGASLLVLGIGIFLFFNHRHRRAPVRVAPARLGLWSFGIATAHGAGLMLVPIYLGLCSIGDLDWMHRALGLLMTAGLPTAVAVSACHAIAMMAAGGVVALTAYKGLNLAIAAKRSFNLDKIWSISLMLIGVISLIHGGAAFYEV